MTDELRKGDYIKSYYIGFEATGVPEVDAILVAVARAGKAYHSTEFWTDEGLDGGPSYLDRIQQAADVAARAHLGCSTITDQQVEAAARQEWEANLSMGRIIVPDGWGEKQWLNYLAARTVYIKHQAEAAARVGTEKK